MSNEHCVKCNRLFRSWTVCQNCEYFEYLEKDMDKHDDKTVEDK